MRRGSNMTLATRAHRLTPALAALLTASLALGCTAQAQPEATKAAAAATAPSEAERLVFLHEHFTNMRAAQTLRYLYVEEAEGRARIDDRAVLTLSAGSQGRCCNVHGDYLSGAMTVNLPDIPDARANPVLLYFLESEVRLLQRTTSGQAAHFRRRIRQALADSATVSDSTVRWGERTVAARTVRVAPYRDDPFRDRFKEQAATEYTFVLSDAVPGGVYQMSATLPATPAGAAPLARRTLTIEAPR